MPRLGGEVAEQVGAQAGGGRVSQEDGTYVEGCSGAAWGAHPGTGTRHSASCLCARQRETDETASRRVTCEPNPSPNPLSLSLSCSLLLPLAPLSLSCPLTPSPLGRASSLAITAPGSPPTMMHGRSTGSTTSSWSRGLGPPLSCPPTPPVGLHTGRGG